MKQEKKCCNISISQSLPSKTSALAVGEGEVAGRCQAGAEAEVCWAGWGTLPGSRPVPEPAQAVEPGAAAGDSTPGRPRASVTRSPNLSRCLYAKTQVPKSVVTER